MKIKRYREVQLVSFEEFFDKATDSGICQYCDSYNECIDYMGYENVESISGNGCSAFDCSVEALKKHFLLEKCVRHTVET